MTAQGSILLVGHTPEDAGLIESMLLEPSSEPPRSVHRVQTVEAALHRLDREPVCGAVLLDLGPPDGPHLKGLAALTTHAADVPVIVLLEEHGEQLGLSAVLAGAQDYLTRGSFDAGLLRRALHYAGQRKRVESALVERALHDALTGLPRRGLLLDRLGVAMKRCARDGSSGTLFFIGLDQFKQINELHGHAAGDAVLQAAGQRLTALVRDSDTVARFGGAEFAVLLPNESGLLEAMAVGEKLLEALRRPLMVNAQELEVSATIGITRFRDATESPGLLMQRAESAMRATATESRGRARLL